MQLILIKTLFMSLVFLRFVHMKGKTMNFIYAFIYFIAVIIPNHYHLLDVYSFEVNTIYSLIMTFFIIMALLVENIE